MGTSHNFVHPPGHRPASVIPLAVISGELPSVEAEDRARSNVLHWLNQRFREQDIQLPPAASHGVTFDIEEGAFRASAIAAHTGDGLRTWALRVCWPGTDELEQWRVEILLSSSERTAEFALRFECVAPLGIQVEHTPPSIAAEVARDCGLVIDGRVNNALPVTLDTEEKIEDFFSLVADPLRRLPVIVITQLEDSENYPRYAIDTGLFAWKTAGLAHVYLAPPDVTFRISDRWGKGLSAYHGGIRMYRPRFNPMTDRSRDHYLALPQSIANAPGGTQSWVNRQIRLIAQQSLRNPNAVEPPAFESFYARAITDDEATARKALEIQLAEERDRHRLSEVELLATIEDLQRQVRHLADENKALQVRIADLVAPPQTEYPQVYEELAPWVRSRFARAVLLHARALRSIKKAQYENPEKVARAIELLATHYRNSRLGDNDAFSKFESEAAALGLELQKTGDKGHLESFDDTYFVQHKRSREFLEWHLKNRGGGRDPRHVVRIYFFWQAQDSQVVIGSLPGHLINAQT